MKGGHPIAGVTALVVDVGAGSNRYTSPEARPEVRSGRTGGRGPWTQDWYYCRPEGYFGGFLPVMPM